MTALQDIAGVDDLFAVPPAEFVKKRNALAKGLEDAGEREAAAAIADLRRPTGPVWAINRLAREHPDEIERYLEIQSSLAAIPDAARLNELAGERRKIVGRLAQLGGKILRTNGQTANNQTLQRIGATLLAADDPEEQEAIRLGLLTQELTVSGFGGMTLTDALTDEDDAGDERMRAEQEADALEAEANDAAAKADRLAEEAATLLQQADAAASEAREARKKADELGKEAEAERARLKRR